MADQITIKVGGVAEAIKNLKQYQFVKTEACKIALKRGAFNIERAAKEGVHVDTGRLRSSITVNWAGSGFGRAKLQNPSRATRNPSTPDDGIGKPTGAKDLVFVVGSNVSYARTEEHGAEKGKRKGRPYLYPAYFMYEGEIVKDIGKVFKKDMRLG